MLLAIDVGNTQAVVGLYEEGPQGELIHMWRLATAKHDTGDDLRARLFPLFRAEEIDPKTITSAVLASVVPALTRAWMQAVRSITHTQALLCSAQSATEAGLFAAQYPNPREIGADRVADAVAARALYGAPVVVVDFGTATNIEVINEQGEFVGGIIAPGVETSANALFSHATRLASIDLVAPPAAIGTSSEEAMQSGIVYGEADRVDGLLRRIFEQLGTTCPVIATGGLASMVAKHSRVITQICPELTLDGLRLLAQNQTSH